MTDYHPLIARAVDGLAKNTGEARRALYERARTALVAQLRAVEPALSESDITKERLALEEAIRKVESEAAHKALVEPRTQGRSEPRPPTRAPRASTGEMGVEAPAARGMSPWRERLTTTKGDMPLDERADARPPEGPQASDEASHGGTKPSARSRILEARTTTLTRQGIKGFRNIINELDGLNAATAKPAYTPRDTHDSYAPRFRPRPPQPEEFSAPPVPEPIQRRYAEERLPPTEDPLLELSGLEPAYDLDEREPIPARGHPPPPAESDEYYEEPLPPRSYRGLVKLAVLLIIVFGVAATTWVYRANLIGFYHSIASSKPAQTDQSTQKQPPVVKFPGRVPQDQVSGQAGAPAGAPNAQQGPKVAQRAVLYEADQNDPQGKRFPGSVIWRTETVSPGPGLAPELVVRADIAIPERHMTVTWSLRRNTDKALPASHTIEIMFNLPPDFPGGGISNVPGILMKDSEEVRGTPLAGLAVKVTSGFFLIGLNAADSDMQHNLQLLKQRAWFDVLIVYNNGSRAILTIEKGPPGDRAFTDAFAAWGK